MNAPIWIAWVIVALLATISILLLTGKCTMLIAGYNTISKEKQRRYNEKMLFNILGIGFSLLTIILAISVYYKFELPKYINWLIPWGYLGTITIMIILANTMCWKKE